MGWQPFGDRTGGATGRGDERGEAFADAETAFWASAVGRATRARMRGDRFFQIELDDATLAAYADAGDASDARDGSGGGRRARRTSDLLGQIEELGWRLEHVSWWRVDADVPVARDASPGHRSTAAGHVKGVYLFHAVPDLTEDVAPAPRANVVGHPPSHRRDVV